MKPNGWGDTATPKVVADVATMLGGGLTFRDNFNAAIITIDAKHNTETRVTNPLQTKPIAFFPISSVCITAVGGQSNGVARPINGIPVLNLARTDGYLGLTVQYAPPNGAIVVVRTTNQAIGTGSATPIQWESVEYQAGTAISFTTSSNTVLTFAEAGRVEITWSAALDTSATGYRDGLVLANGENCARQLIPGGSYAGFNASDEITVNASTTLAVTIFQNSGVSLNIFGAGVDRPMFRARYVAPSATVLGRVTGILVGG